ncbi:ankyrin repeat domain-containing protein [Chromatiaceae bacterium AAb-1]|nr:ankyrin repeat domain-containing protein [Chromatiaceae bacterium AAb-1]
MKTLIFVLSLCCLALPFNLQAGQITAGTEPASVTEQRQLIDYFFAAARTGNTEVLDEFLSAGFPVNLQNADSYTALMTATYYGHAQAVDLLLTHGADACIRDKRDHTAMMGAIVKAEWSIARTLYRIDCDTQAGQQGVKTLEEFAAVFGQSEKLAALKQEADSLKTGLYSSSAK